MSTLLLTGVRPLGGPARDLLVEGGRITRAGQGLAAPEGATVVDGQGQLAVPGWSTPTPTPTSTRPSGGCPGGPTPPGTGWPP